MWQYTVSKHADKHVCVRLQDYMYSKSTGRFWCNFFKLWRMAPDTFGYFLVANCIGVF